MISTLKTFSYHPLRTTEAISQIMTFLTHSLLGRNWYTSEERKVFHLKQTSYYSRKFLRTLNIKVECDHSQIFSGQENFLIVSNHQSYLDALVLASIVPTVFVTSVEMQNSPFVGLMAELGASLFIERRNKRNIDEEIALVTRTLEEGFHVGLFPEGTSTDGHELKPFKVSFFEAARKSYRQVLPLSINFTEIDGQPFDRRNCDRVCWYGDMEFFPHLLGLMSLKSVTVQIKVGTPLHPTHFPDRIALAHAAQAQVQDLFF